MPKKGDHTVVHISREVHAKVKQFCKQHRIGMKELTEHLLLAEIDKSPLAPHLSVVQRGKKLQNLTGEKNGGEENPWTRPAFFQQRNPKFLAQQEEKEQKRAEQEERDRRWIESCKEVKRKGAEEGVEGGEGAA